MLSLIEILFQSDLVSHVPTTSLPLNNHAQTEKSHGSELKV